MRRLPWSVSYPHSRPRGRTSDGALPDSSFEPAVAAPVIFVEPDGSPFVLAARSPVSSTAARKQAAPSGRRGSAPAGPGGGAGRATGGGCPGGGGGPETATSRGAPQSGKEAAI